MANSHPFFRAMKLRYCENEVDVVSYDGQQKEFLTVNADCRLRLYLFLL